jgi:hypothetical protein
VNTPQDQPYTNSVIVNNKVLVPFMNSSWDDSAKAAYEAAMPGYTVKGFIGNPSTPWESTDALHCRVMGIADVGILFIHHIPVAGNQPCEADYVINADIIACSDSALKSDSVLLRYKVNSGSYKVLHMANTSGIHYTATIPKQAGGSTIKYYISAADKSGRHATAPFIGEADPFVFHTVYTDITVVPDTVKFDDPMQATIGLPVTIHNYTGFPKTILNIQESGSLWWISPWPVVPNLPYVLAPGDSVPMVMHCPVAKMRWDTGYVNDTMRVTSASYVHRVLVMVNKSLLIGIPETGTERSVFTVRPNPFRETAMVEWILPEDTKGALEVYDMQGRLINVLLNGIIPGKGSAFWNGRTASGLSADGGIYLLRLTTDRGTLTRRLVLIR